MKALHIISFLVLVVGGINLLALGLFGWELGSLFGGQDALASRVIYIVIGVAAVYELFAHKTRCKDCSVSERGDSSPNPQAQSGEVQ